jgi:putative addiction module component (TIGR02574 family)
MIHDVLPIGAICCSFGASRAEVVVFSQSQIYRAQSGVIDDCSAFFRYTFVMSQETAELLKRALNLSVAERAELADSLIESLEAGEDTAVQAAWDAEILRRMKDLESGTVKPVSLEEARRRLSSAVE